MPPAKLASPKVKTLRSPATPRGFVAQVPLNAGQGLSSGVGLTVTTRVDVMWDWVSE
jgi:hypothetical protein